MPTPVKLPELTDASIAAGTYVLVRAALNVPVVNEVVQNTFRLRQSTVTLSWLQERGARVIVVGHIGREATESLAPVSAALQEFCPHTFVSATTGAVVQTARDQLRDGEVLLLENTRQHPEEKDNDADFAAALARLVDVFVLDAFADAHRAHASVVGVARFLPTYAGIHFAREYHELQKAMEPTSPSLFLIGGAKPRTKLPLIEQYLKLYDTVFVGGALANDIFRAKGYEVGNSLVSDVAVAESPLMTASNILIPVDVTVSSENGVRTTTPESVAPNETIMDIGPDTVELLTEYTQPAQTILWNGPMGNYEAGFVAGTEGCARLVAASDAQSFVGGGDTIAAIEAGSLTAQFSFLSTAGGAMLAFLENNTLPGIDAILAAPAEKQV